MKLNHTKVGSLIVDCSSMDYLTDLPPGATVGFRTTQEGYSNVVVEILSNQSDYGVDAGITAADIAAVERDEQRIAEIDAVLPAVNKVAEMLLETRAQIDDERHRRISEIAALVDARSRARRNPELLARYEKTREYRSAVAKKAVATRRRNQLNAATATDTDTATDASVD
jgi:hypothetical protein